MSTKSSVYDPCDKYWWCFHASLFRSLKLLTDLAFDWLIVSRHNELAKPTKLYNYNEKEKQEKKEKKEKKRNIWSLRIRTRALDKKLIN